MTVKSSPVREKAFSFMWRVTGSGWHCERVGPRGGLKGVRGAMVGARSPLSLQDVREGRVPLVLDVAEFQNGSGTAVQSCRSFGPSLLTVLIVSR